MFGTTNVFSSFSVDDIEAAKKFYGETLGLETTEGLMGNLDLTFGGEVKGQAFIYAKPNHVPATFTVLNFSSDDVEKTVDELNARGVVTKIYGDDELPDMPPNDAKGIMRGDDGVPQLAWFRDPAGNVLAIVSSETPG